MADEWVTISEEDEWADIPLTQTEMQHGGTFAEFAKGLISGELGVAKGLVGTAKAAISIPQERFRKVGTAWGGWGGIPEDIRLREEKKKQERIAFLGKTKARIASAQERFVKTHAGAGAWAGRVIGEAIPYMANAMAGGYIAGPAGAAMVGFAVEGDNAYDDAIASGATEEQAQTERVIVGSLNAAIEALQITRLMKFHKTGKHSVKNFVQLAKNKAYKQIAVAGKEFGADILRISVEEALEEFAQEGVSMGVPALLRGEYPIKEDGTTDWWAVGERLGGAALGGAVAGGVLGAAGQVRIGLDQASITEQAAEQLENGASKERIKTVVEQQIIGNIQTRERIISRFPEKITDQESLERVGNAIADELGIERPASWSFVKNKNIQAVSGYWSPANKKIVVKQGGKAYKIGSKKAVNWAWNNFGVQVKVGDKIYPSQGFIKRTIIHELSHSQQVTTRTVTGRRRIHTPEFRTLVQDTVIELFGKKQIPIAEPTVAEVPVEPTTSEQAIGQQYGLSNEEVDTRLAQAEGRYRELKQKETTKRTTKEAQELKFLKKKRTDIESLLEWDTTPREEAERPRAIRAATTLQRPSVETTPFEKVHRALDFPGKDKAPDSPITLDRNAKLKLGHQIAKKMGMKETEFETYKQTYGGQSSMADMSETQLDDLLTQLEQDGIDSGLAAEDIEITKTPVEELTEQTQSLKRYKPISERQKRKRSTIASAYYVVKEKISSYFQIQERIRNLCRNLDNYEDSGPFTRYFWDPIKQVKTRTAETWGNLMAGVKKTFDEGGVDVDKMMTETREDVIEGFPLTESEICGLYLLSKNEKSHKKVAVWMADNGIVPSEAFDAIAKIVKANEQMSLVAGTIEAYFRDNSQIFLDTAKALGIKGVIQEKNYFPMLDEEQGEAIEEDVLDIFTKQFEDQLQLPGKKHTIARKGGRRKVEWDIIKAFVNASNRMQTFVDVGPVAHEVNKIAKNEKFKHIVNDATNGHGAKMIGTWLRDSVRGFPDNSIKGAERTIRFLRRNSVVFTLGLKVFTSGPKAVLSAVNAMALRPAMIPAMFKTLAEFRRPARYKQIREEVFRKSPLAKHRDAQRDIRIMWGNKNIRKFFKGKKLSHFATRYWSAADRTTVITVWKSAYDVAKSDGVEEMEARRYADNAVSKTQPMANIEDLPSLFRGGELQKSLTTFMNMPNTTWQFLRHDILGELRAKKISRKMGMYRFLTGEMVPAMLLGMIVRGRLPATAGEAVKDLISYLMTPLVFVGRFIFNLTTGGWDPLKSALSTMPVRGFEGGVDTFRAMVKGDIPDVVEGVARTTGAFTGAVPEQAIISARGAYDLATGESDNYKRLIYTEGGIKWREPPKEETKPGIVRRKQRGRAKQRR